MAPGKCANRACKSEKWLKTDLHLDDEKKTSRAGEEMLETTGISPWLVSGHGCDHESKIKVFFGGGGGGGCWKVFFRVAALSSLTHVYVSWWCHRPNFGPLSCREQLYRDRPDLSCLVWFAHTFHMYMAFCAKNH